jgi:hypothetical protein
MPKKTILRNHTKRWQLSFILIKIKHLKLLKHLRKLVLHMSVSLMIKREDIMIKLVKSLEITKDNHQVEEVVSDNHILNRTLTLKKYSICFSVVVCLSHPDNNRDNASKDSKVQGALSQTVGGNKRER